MTGDVMVLNVRKSSTERYHPFGTLGKTSGKHFSPARGDANRQRGFSTIPQVLLQVLIFALSMSNQNDHIKIFIAYSRLDAEYLNRLRTYLAPLSRKKTLKIWYDGKIVPGTEWEGKIKEKLADADIIILLVSANSLASEYFHNKEMMAALERHEKGEAAVIPVILSDCPWEFTDLHELQALPKDGKPIKNWASEESAYTNIVRGIYKCVEEIKSRTATPDGEVKTSPIIKPKENRIITPPKLQLSAPIQKLLDDMVYVEGGTFNMGSNEFENEGPIHKVTLKDFHICKYCITQSQWKAIMGNNLSHFKGDDLPVEMVSWNDAQKFLTALNKQTGKNFRLPTEAEWEYTARGGLKSQDYEYAGSNNIDEVAWYDNNGGNRTHPVGQKKSNALDLYDMSGNVWEWCSDWYGFDYYQESQEKNPTGPDDGSDRILRGGSWVFNAKFCRVADRGGSEPSKRYDSCSFRICR